LLAFVVPDLPAEVWLRGEGFKPFSARDLARNLAAFTIVAERGPFAEQCFQIASAVEDADDFDAGAVGELAVENKVVGELSDDPGAKIFPAAELPLPPPAGDCATASRIPRKSLPGRDLPPRDFRRR